MPDGRSLRRRDVGFHIAVDRLLGYGLKFTDSFAHTHLGEIGKKP